MKFPRLRALSLALLALSPVTRATVPAQALDDCVHVPDITAARAKAGSATVGASVDIGNLTVIELDGDYGRGLDAPRMAVAQRFFETHADRYDFLVTFTTFEFETGPSVAFYSALRNDVRGIGSPLADVGQHYGSAARLQGYVDMAATSRYAFAPGDARYRNVLSTLAHEIMHRWGARVSYRTPAGEVSRALLGEDGAHWSYFLDTDASLMYGAEWSRRADGRYESVAIRQRFSPLDLYVAGFAAASEVPDMDLITGGDGNATDLPRLGAVSGGTTDTVSIGQIIAAEGPRIPDATQAPKDFRAALILIKRPGETVPADTLAALEGVRVRLQQYFNQATDGRASLRLYNEPADALPQSPPVLVGSSAATAPPGIAAAVDWIRQRQLPDGHWQDRPATAVRDTAAAVQLLAQVDADWPGLARARDWLATQTPANRDQQGWQLVASAQTASAPLLAAQSAAGGWSLAAGLEDSTLDTAHVADALARRDGDTAAVRLALARLGDRQNVDGSFALAAGGRGRMLPTLRAARALGASTLPAHQAIREAAALWLADRRRADGSFGDAGTPFGDSALADTIELYSLVGQLPLPATASGSARDFVIAAQRSAGDWQGSVYLTASAALAQLYDNKPNLAAAGAATVLPADAIEGDRLTLQVRIANTGALAAPASMARWYDADPADGGAPIGSDQPVPALSAGATTLLQRSWDSTGHTGARTLWLLLDTTDLVAEQNEADNRIAVPVALAPSPAQADIALDATRFTLTPPALATLPATITLSGEVRNAGGTAVNAAHLVLYDDTDPPRALAAATIDLPARGVAPLQLAFTAGNAATLRLRLVADPDGLIAEARENNNDAQFVLPFGPSLDLDVTDGDLALLDPPATQGRDVGFRLRVRNRGTLSANDASLRVALHQGATQEILLDERVTVDPGQTLERRLYWRAREAGAATLHVVLDAAGEIAELDESNNAAQLPFTIAAGSGSDLAVVADSLQFVPSPALQGQPLQLSVHVRNQGAEASTASTLALFASDPRSGGTRIAQAQLAGLAPQAETTMVLNVADLDLAGDTAVFVAADADQQITESDESNNLALYTLAVLPFADVAVASAGLTLLPSQPAPGAPQQVQAVVRNLGAQAAHDIVLRLFEGSAETGVAVGNDQVVAELAAGAETTLTWNWTFGLQPGARQLTLVADAAGTVRENQELNNVAILPLALQDAAFYASERFISPNGDGVRDATALYFARNGAGRIDIVVRNRAGRVVRRYDDVLGANGASGQLVWDGRDLHGRVVADGVYVAGLLTAGQAGADIAIRVDTNRSSLVAAIGTPLLADMPLPAERAWFPPPFTDATRETLFARARSADPLDEIQGIYRTSTVVPELAAVVSSRWVRRYLEPAAGELDDVGAAQFSPDGRRIAFYIHRGTTRALAVAESGQNDQVIVLDASAVPDAQAHRRQQPRFVDANRVLAGAFPQLFVYDLQTRVKTPLRELPDDSLGLRAYAHGFYVWRTQAGDAMPPAYYVPQDAQRAIVNLPPVQDGEQMSFHINADGTRALIRRYADTQESLHLFRAESGAESPLRQRVPEAHAFPSLGEPGRLPTLQAQWISADDSLLVIDAATREVQILNRDGAVRASAHLPPADPALDLGPDPAQFDSGHRRADTLFSGDGCDGSRTNCSGALWLASDRRQQWFDPATRTAVVLLASEHIGPVACEAGRCFGHAPATLEAFAIDVDDGGHARIAAMQNAAQLPTDLQPRLRLIDDGVFAIDGRYGNETNLSYQPWRHRASLDTPAPPWGDGDASLIVGSGMPQPRAVTALTNLSAQLWAEPTDRAVRLSGVASDINFAYYELDWATPSAPAQWHAITPPQNEPVLGDEFLSWIPPQPGHYLVRLRVVDKAGNSTTRVASALSSVGSPVFDLGLESRYFSPNGDGVKDFASVHFRLTTSAQVAVRIRDALGNLVRERNTLLSAGPQTFVWDGRDDGDQRLADGDYRIDVAGQSLEAVLDTTPPALTGRLMQPNLPFGDGAGNDPDYTRKLEVYGEADDRHLDRLRYDLRPIDGGDWYEAPFQESGVLSRSDYGVLAGKALRAVADDRAGNRTVLELGAVVEQLLFATCNSIACGDALHLYPATEVGPITYPAAFPEAVDLVVDDPDQVELWLQDGSTGLAAIDIEIADAQRPGEWSVFATLPGTRPPFTFDNSHRGIALALPWRNLPQGADRRLRAVGIRPDGSRLYGDQLRLRTRGLGEPLVFCPGIDPANVQDPDVRELLSPLSDDIQVVVPAYYDGIAEAVELRLGSDAEAIGNGTYRRVRATAHNARHAYFRFPPPSGPEAIDTAAAVLINASGLAIVTVADMRCGSSPPPPPNRGLELRGEPVDGERCSGIPTQQWRVVAAHGQIMQHYELALAGAGRPLTPLLDETPAGNDATAGSAYPWMRDTIVSVAGIPEGRYRAIATATAGAVRFDGTTLLEIDHDPARAGIDWPSSGSRICAARDAAGYPVLDLAASIDSDSRVRHRLSLTPQQTELGTFCPDPTGLLSTQNCLGQPSEMEASQIREIRATGPAVADLDGHVDAELEVANASGAVVCSTTSFELDSVAQLGAGGAPEPGIGTFALMRPAPPGERQAEPRVPLLGLSVNGAPRFRAATVPLVAREALSYRASLHALIAIVDNGTVSYAVGGELATLAEGQDITGAFQVSWDGRIGGNTVPDGLYAIRVQASDACGWTATRDHVVDLDSTPPTLAIIAPSAGAIPADPVVAISGTVDDAHFSSFPIAQPYWQLSVEHGGSSQLIAEDDEPVPQATVLGRWSRGTAQHAGRYLLRAADDFGNTAEIAQAFGAPVPLQLLGGAQTVPELFSPNGDGRLDRTQVRLQLLVAARVDVRIRDAGGAVVAELAQDMALNAGIATLDWDGGGLSDGRYGVDIIARGAAMPEVSETALLALTLDTAAPVVRDVTPAGAYATGTDTVSFRVDDAHFDRFDAQLVAGGNVVAQLAGTGNSVQTLATLAGMAEGDYRLRVLAQDRAGNRSERAHAFTLDITAPEAGLSAPAADAVVPRRDTPLVLRGNATDAILHDYRVELVPAGSETGVLLASGDTAVAAAPLGHWVVTQADGDYRLRLRVRDHAGNTAVAQQAIAIDGTPPGVAITSPANGAAIAGRLLVLGTVQDAHLHDYLVAIATPTAALAEQWTPLQRGLVPVDAGVLADIGLPLPDGDYVLRVLATDTTGAQTEARVDLRIDRVAPDAPLQLRARLGGADAVLDWNASTAGDVAGYAVYRNGQRITPALLSAPHHVDGVLPDGTWRYAVSAIDRAGNESARSNRVELTLDRTPPQVELHSPLATSRIRGVVSVIGTAWSSDDFDTYTLTARRSDGSGGTLLLAQGSLPQRDAVLAQWNSLVYTEESNVTLHLAARDRSGNEAIREIELVVDNQAPAAPQGVVANLQGADGTIAWNPNAEGDLLGYLLYRNGRLVNGPAQLPEDLRGYALPATTYLDSAVSDGTHRYVVFAIDRAGNLSPPSAPAELGPIDNGPPHLVIDAPEDGAAFETALDVRASSADRDIASVQFAYRAAGASDWTALGPAQTEAPYRLRWTPGELPHGDYAIRALARDVAGLDDPQPPQVNVRYADLTPPSAPGALQAIADGDTVHLQWNASADASVVAYRVERSDGGDWQPVGDDTPGTTRSDGGRDDGRWRYRVSALDAAGNVSSPSSDEAQVFSLTLTQPFSPTTQAGVTLDGRSALPGTLSVRIGDGSEQTMGGTTGDGRFLLSDLVLADGDNAIGVRVTTAEGDRSRTATRWVRRAAVPAAPTGLSATATGYDVDLVWNANPETDVIGYRVEHNGGYVHADDTIDGVTAASTTCCEAAAAADASVDTYWDVSTWLEPVDAEAATDPLLELDLGAPALVSALEFDWRDAATATGNLDVYAHAGHDGWVRIARPRAAAAAVQRVTLTSAYRTDALRIAVRSPSGSDGYAHLTLADVRVRTWHLVDATTLRQTVVDGAHRYRVAAVSSAALQSAWSMPADVGVGDTTPPDPVVLTGTLTANDASLSWTASMAADVARYRLLRNGTALAEIAATAERRHIDTNLALGSYAYEVLAIDAFGNASAASNRVTLDVTGTGPGVPQDLVVTAPPQGGLLHLAWHAGDGSAPARYRVRRALSADGAYADIADATATAFDDSPLTNGTRFHYTIEAIDSAGNRSGPSAVASGVPRDTLAPPAPILTYPAAGGANVAINGDRSPVCGRAEPGSRVDVWRDGTVLASTIAAASLQQSDVPANLSYLYAPLQIAADGWHLADAGNGLRIIDLRDGHVEFVADTAYLPQWSPQGLTLHYLADGRLYATRPGDTPQALPFVADSLRNYAVSADASRVLFYGRFEGSADDALWWMRRDGTAARTITGLASLPLAADERMHLRDDARYAALATDDGRLAIVDLGAARVIDVIAADTHIWPRWSPDGSLAFTRSDSGTPTLWRYDVVTRSANPRFALPLSTQAFVWSPDRSAIAVLAGNHIEGRSALDGALQFDAAAPAQDSNIGTFGWSANGNIILIGANEAGFARAYVWQPPGSFCTGTIALQAGANLLTATATDSAGNRSGLSLPVTLTVDGTALPDLAVAGDDLFFLPASPAPGQRVSALATVRNRGAGAVPAVLVEAVLRAPDGSLRPVAAPAPFALAAGESRPLTFDLGEFDQSGAYRLRIAADPAGAVAEADERNNVAEAQLAVTTAADPLLDVAIADAALAPGAALAADLRVTNPGAAFSGRLRAQVLADDDTVVTELGDVLVSDLATAQTFTRTIAWSSTGVLAGHYRLRAQLLRSDGSFVAERSAGFAIGLLRRIDLAIASTPSAQAVGHPVELESRLQFSAGNALLTGATLHTEVLAPSGARVFGTTQALGTLSPGYQLRKVDTWTTDGTAGVYTLRLRLSAPGHEATAESSLTLTEAGIVPRLTGTLAFTPSARLVAGQPGELIYRIDNGGAALPDLPLRLRVLRASGLTAMFEREETLDLAAAANHEQRIVLEAPPLALEAYVAVLDARLPGDAPGTWRELARQGFSVADELPPEITLESPLPAVLQPAVVTLRARIADVHSGIAQAQARIDDGIWQPLALDADGRWSLHASGLADGAHHIVIRARDTWGNESHSTQGSFDVDVFAPIVSITGVAEDALVNQVVTPAITIDDAHLDATRTSVRLDGQPYAAGTPIASDGAHTIAVVARDTAGNETHASRHFTIDRTPPALAIASPSDGSVVTQSAVDVVIDSEADARIALTAGAWQAERIADAGGQAVFAAVPLVEGDNRIEAIATDAAGNGSVTRSIHVRLEIATALPLAGTLQPAQAELPHGTALEVAVQLRNPGTLALPTQSVRLRITAADGAVLAQRDYARAFAGGETFSDTPSFATTAWPLGDAAIRLEIERDGSWHSLDQQNVTVVDRTAPYLQALAPSDGAVVAAPLRLLAMASDVLSAPVTVDASVDDGPWTSLTGTGTDTFESAALKPTDGTHHYRLRAHDSAGNEALAASVTFTVDSLPPQIAIAGIANGDLVNHAVTPQITVSDSNLRTTTLRLDGQPYVDGTPILASGGHVLRVDADDEAGNAASREIAFTIDREAPIVVVDEPAPGSTVNTAAQAIAGTTEPGADVAVDAPGLTTTVRADASGAFRTAAATLQPGGNTVRLRATDRAGNVGDEIVVHVSYAPPAGEVLSVLLADSAITLRRGEPLQVDYTLRNSGTVALDAAPVRVQLQAADSGTPVAQDDYTISLSPGAEVARSSTFATDALDPAAYRIELAASLRDAQGQSHWTVLATLPVQLRQGCPAGRPLDLLFRNGFQGAIEDLLFCDGFDTVLPKQASSARGWLPRLLFAPARWPVSVPRGDAR